VMQNQSPISVLLAAGSPVTVSFGQYVH
jgi:hypothetical protein